MYQAELALVPGTEFLGRVLDRMQRTSHAAVVVSVSHNFTIVTADQVLKALRELGPDVSVASIGTMEKPLMAPRSSEAADWMIRPDIRRGLSAALETGASKHAILNIEGERAVVATSDQTLARAFNLRIMLCRCKDEPAKHVWQPHELNTPGVCNLDNAEVDCK